MKNRAMDFVDCFKADVGYGLGIGAHVRATEFFSGGAGAGMFNKVGFKGRYTGKWKDAMIGWPFPNMVFALYANVPNAEALVAIFCIPAHGCIIGYESDFSLLEMEELWEFREGELVDGGYAAVTLFAVNIFAFCPGQVGGTEYLDIEVGIFAAGVACHIGFSPIEFLDFLLGWTTLDIAGDDYKPETDEEEYREDRTCMERTDK
jgi:hypothetical protein